MTLHPNAQYMLLAIAEAEISFRKGDYAIGAVIVRDNQILAIEHTRIDELINPTAHAEILAVQLASRTLKSEFLEGAYLYSTLEPCPMCSSAAIWAKMKGIVFGATMEDAQKVYLKEINNLHNWRQINIKAEYIIRQGTPPHLEVHSNFMRDECLKLFYLTK